MVQLNNSSELSKSQLQRCANPATQNRKVFKLFSVNNAGLLIRRQARFQLKFCLDEIYVRPSHCFIRLRCNGGKFRVHEPVWVKDVRHKNKWLSGIISKQLGTNMYLVRLTNGELARRHHDQLRRCPLPTEVITSGSGDPHSDVSTVSSTSTSTPPASPPRSPTVPRHQLRSPYLKRTRQAPDRLVAGTSHGTRTTLKKCSLH